MHSRSQAVRLPKAFRFEGKEVRISKEGKRVILEPIENPPFDVAAWRAQLTSLEPTTFCRTASLTAASGAGRVWQRPVSGLLCLDTNIVVFALNGRRPEIAARLDAELARATPMLVPAIVLFELSYGYAKSAQRKLNKERLAVFLQRGSGSRNLTCTMPQKLALSAQTLRDLEHLLAPTMF